MMGLLLKFEGYPPAVVFAIALHAGLMLFFLDRELSPNNQVRIEPQYVSVSTAEQNPQRLRRLQELELMRAQEQRRQREKEAIEQAAREAAAREQEALAAAEAERKRQQEVQQRQADARRQEAERQAEEERRAQALREAEQERERQRVAELERQRAEEAARQAKAQTQAQQAENSLVGQYTSLIKDLISQNWKIPPDARNGMTALVELRTTPVGDIVSYRVIESNGTPAFNSSVLQAVARVGNLRELQDLPYEIYQRNFRIFHLEFKPEDLLR